MKPYPIRLDKGMAKRRKAIREICDRLHPSVFVETGTYRGDTVASLLDRFEELHTIELQEDWFEAARKRFAGEPKVVCHHGDSRTVLAEVLESIDCSCLCWLDAHYLGGKLGDGEVNIPVLKEVDAVLGHRYDDVVMIDDAKVFTTWRKRQPGWPCYADIEHKVYTRHPDWRVYVSSGIIFAHRKEQICL